MKAQAVQEWLAGPPTRFHFNYLVSTLRVIAVINDGLQFNRDQHRPTVTADVVTSLAANAGQHSMLFAILAGSGLRIGGAAGGCGDLKNKNYGGRYLQKTIRTLARISGHADSETR